MNILTIKGGVNFIFRKLWYTLNKPLFKKLGEKSFIAKPLKISKKNIWCGKQVWVWKYCRIEAITHWNNTLYTPQIIFEDRVSIQQFLHLTCAKKIHIAKNTAIASGVTITDINHKYTNINQPIEEQDIETMEVFIGEDSKIYNNVVILPGTYLGKHCVVGANSVVSGNFPDYCIIVGTPAKIIKRYCFNDKKWKKTDKKGNFVD